jgi:NADH:ubiquinone oxidoreductase subunit 6 (subunit J)
MIGLSGIQVIVYAGACWLGLYFLARMLDLRGHG